MKTIFSFRAGAAETMLILCCAFWLLAFTHAPIEIPATPETVPAATSPTEGGGGDPPSQVEILYRELMSQNPALKKLDDEINDLLPRTAEFQRELSQSEGKSRQYYDQVRQQLVTITDPELKKMVTAMVEKSNQQYAEKTAQILSLLSAADQNLGDIMEHYKALKIMLTLPMIEEYQAKNMPDTKAIEQMIQEQKQMLDKIQKTFPKG